jgi:hypothetical protein
MGRAMNKFLRVGAYVAVVLMCVSVLVFLIAGIRQSFDAEMSVRWHITCPQGMYSGDVRHSGFLGYVDISTGQRVIIPDNCTWVELK